MNSPIGIIDLDALPPVDETELAELIRRDLAGLPDEDQAEIMEIAGDLFTPEELKAMLDVDVAGMEP
jgi:DNA-directed RNA polymerase specialized sigma24 family protein